MADERRRHSRQAIALPTRVTGRNVQSDVGMTLDLSASGALVTTRHRYRIGERVAITFRTPAIGNRDASTVLGTVVRQRRAEEPDTLWPNEIAIRFDTVARELLPLLDRPEGTWRVEDRMLLSSDEPSYRT